MARKFGPTKGEFQFRLCAGLVIFALLGVAFAVKGIPQGLTSTETFLFGGAFAAFLVGQAAWRLWRKDYRLG